MSWPRRRWPDIGYRYDTQAVLAAIEAEVIRRGMPQNDTSRAEIAGVNRQTVLRWRLGQKRVALHRVVDRVEQETGVHASMLEAR